VRAAFAPSAWAVGVLALAFGLPASAPAEAVDVARFIPLVAAVLKVEAPTHDGRVNVGTAITVAEGVVVTNCHVTRNATSVRLLKGGGSWPVAGQVSDWNHDLCFLSVPNWRGAPVDLGPSAPDLYTPVVAAGFTRGAGLSMSPGEVTGLHGYEGERIIQSTSRFSSGASGGALLDDSGRLVGVLTFRLRGNRDHFFSVPAAWVRKRLPIAEGLFEPIGAGKGGRAFWEGGCCVPYFMQVDQLRSQARWPELLALAEAWIAYDEKDADAWHASGVAQARLGRTEQAVAALERAVALAPRHAQAWYEMGIAGAARGDDVTARRAREALVELGSELADRLAVDVAPGTAGEAGNPADGGQAGGKLADEQAERHAGAGAQPKPKGTR
jgi:hypothetical protein